jgi:HK97 family phage major capsid protein
MTIENLQRQFEGHHQQVLGLADEVKKLRIGLDESLKAYARLSVGGGSRQASELGPDRLAEFNAALRSSIPHATPVDAERLAAYAAAETAYWRLGAAAPPSIRNEMSVGSESDGGYVVSPERSARIKARLFETSPMRSVATVIPSVRESWEQVLDPNDLTSGGWVTEKASRSETDTPKIGLQKIETHEQFAEPHLTQKLLDDADVDIGGYIEGKIADKFARTENTAFVTGAGVNQPRGFLDYASASVTTDDSSRSWGVLQYVPTGSASGFPTSGSADDPNCLIDLMHKLKPAYLPRAVWVMKRATAATVRKLKDADGRWLWLDSLTDGGRPMLLGHPVVFFEDMPAIASGAFPIAFGDFMAGYTIIDRLGMTVLRDPYTSKGYVKFYARKRVGADVTDFDSIKLLKVATS